MTNSELREVMRKEWSVFWWKIVILITIVLLISTIF